MAARGQRSSVVEQLFRKQQVFGSNPNVGSSFLYLKRAFWLGYLLLFTASDTQVDTLSGLIAHVDSSAPTF